MWGYVVVRAGHGCGLVSGIDHSGLDFRVVEAVALGEGEINDEASAACEETEGALGVITEPLQLEGV